MMNGWTIRQRILGSFAGILVMLAIMGALAYLQLREIQARLLENFSRLQQHMLADDTSAMVKIETEIMAERATQLASFRDYEKTVFQDDDRTLFETFKASVGPYWAVQDRVLRMSTARQGAELKVLVAGELAPAFAKARAAINAVIVRNESHAVETFREIEASIAMGTNVVMAGMGAIFALSCVAGYGLMRAISQPLQRLVAALDVMRSGDFTGRMKVERRDEFGVVAEGFNRMTDELAVLVGQVQQSSLQVNTSITEIAATSKEQQATASEIAATTTEIGATSTEISATSRQLVKTMGDVAAVAEQSATLAGSGQAGLAHMADTMRHVMEATKGINAKLVVLNEKAGKINQVITTISKVAEQTNLLSLNAAIEAEKAGEHGRGFAVVATEIRRLADQTAVATYDIGQTVKEIEAAVSSSVMGMDKFSDEVRRGMAEVQQVSGQLSQIIEQVQTLAPRVEDVNDGMQAQAAGAEQITLALSQLNESAQQTVESLRQSAMAIEDLNQVSLSLRGGVSRFKLRA
jgi:methyl-accepting chemotaxis protein WspA